MSQKQLVLNANENDTRQFHVASSLIDTLQQIANLVNDLNDESYVKTNVASVEGSIGAHLRHCIDHFHSLIESLDSGVMNYDARDRGVPIERNRLLALKRITEIQIALSKIDHKTLSNNITISTMIDSSNPPLRVSSSFGRELSFVLSHTIHHNAIIRVIAENLGVRTLRYFGYAPSTIAFLES